ncbi:MAG: DUF58 domain-containing protein [Cellvibrionaceae bacterium]
MTDELFTNKRLSENTIEHLQRWINLHRVLWFLAIVSFFSAWNRGLALLYGLFSLLLALLLLSYVLPHFQLRGIRIERKPIGDFTVGSQGTIRYNLSAPGNRYHIELRDQLPFCNSENNNFLFFTEIQKNTSADLTFFCELRGCYSLNQLELMSAYPFGVFHYHHKVPSPPLEILVFPKIHELVRIPSPAIADSTTADELPIKRQGGRDEFTAIREYRHGDELSRVHWAASARHNTLVVKEYEHSDRPALLVAIDCRPTFNVGEGTHSTLEFAISIAASMIHYAAREGMQCFLVAEDGEWHDMIIPAFTADFHGAYELLARLTPTGTLSSCHLLEQGQARFPQANLLTGFRLNSDEQLPEFPAHITHIDLEMDEKSFRNPLHKPALTRPKDLGTRLIWPVYSSMDLDRLFQ